jgi:hypothetical protein
MQYVIYISQFLCQQPAGLPVRLFFLPFPGVLWPWRPPFVQRKKVAIRGIPHITTFYSPFMPLTFPKSSLL